jgi:hypothetical protein
MSKEAIQHYESALKEAFPSGATGDVFFHWNEARKALAEQPAPVIKKSCKQCAYQYHLKENTGPCHQCRFYSNFAPTQQPPAQPLTDEQIFEIKHNWITTPFANHLDFARAIEAAHGITKGNT